MQRGSAIVWVLIVLVVAGALVGGYAAWRMRQRMAHAMQQDKKGDQGQASADPDAKTAVADARGDADAPSPAKDPKGREDASAANGNGGDNVGDDAAAANGNGDNAKEPADAGPLSAEALQEELDAIEALREDVRFGDAMKRAMALRGRVEGAKEKYELNKLIKAIRKEQFAAAGLDRQVEKLGSEEEMVRRAAADKILGEGELGRRFLRKEIRKGAGRSLAEAIRLLERENDPAVPPILADRWLSATAPGADPRTAEAAPLFRKGLTRYVETLPDDDREIVREPLTRIYRDRWTAAEGERKRWIARALLTPLARWFEAKKTPWEEWLGVEGIHDALGDYVETALHAEDEAARTFALDHLPLFDILRPGWRGRYYKGTDFGELVFQRLDPKIHWPDGGFGYPKKRKDKISIRWTGKLHVPKDGTYTFYSTSDDGQRLWVNGKQIIDDWERHGMETKAGKLKLAAGVVDIRHEFFQGRGGLGVIVEWAGPGFDKRLITAEHVSTPPWPDMEEAASAAADPDSSRSVALF